MKVTELIDLYTQEHQRRSNPLEAKRMKAYMRDQYDFLGIKAPVRKEIFRPIWTNTKALHYKSYKEIVDKLWALPEREYQMLALEILSKVEKRIPYEELFWIESLITTKSWWDTVDFLASNSVGCILKKDSKKAVLEANRMMSSSNLWLKRTSILFQLKYKTDTNFELLTSLILKTIGSKEFFINKANGWALRQYSKYNKEAVSQFIHQNRDDLAPLTIKEGSKYL